MSCYLRVSILFVLAQFTCSCKDDVGGPTVFQGKVVYADESPMINGMVGIVPVEHSITPGCCSKEAKLDTLDDSATFYFEFDYNENFDAFVLSVNDDQRSYHSESSLSCSPFECDDFEPGQTYSNLIIRVIR